MDISPAHKNARTLQAELEWFSQRLETMFQYYFQAENLPTKNLDIPPPDLEKDDSKYATLIKKWQFGFEERLVLILALLPHLKPQALDIFFTQNQNFGRTFTEFGGIKGQQHSGFLPTGETAAWLIAGDQLQRRFYVQYLFSKDHPFAQQQILSLENAQQKEPLLSGALQISKEYLSLLTKGQSYQPEYSSEFPATLLTTHLEWSDLVLPKNVKTQLEELHVWINHQALIMEEWGLKKTIKSGFRTLFYGPPGTGKSFTAALLGKITQRPVYRLDLSKVVSKYIGETEKNLAKIFDQAENKDWILFFDEADALFGKRGETKDARDRYANQEVSYLLQRIEGFAGLVILATNFKQNVDEAFARRFQSMIYFPLPDAEARLSLWENTMPKALYLDEQTDLTQIAEEYELSGGAIINVVRNLALSAARTDSQIIQKSDFIYSIKRELKKEGKFV